MSRVFHDLQIGLNEELAEKLAWMVPHYSEYRILRQSVDARQRHNPHFVYSVEVAEAGETLSKQELPISEAPIKPTTRPLIVGSGPAGLFAALRFVERGVGCLLIERGSQAETRIKGINHFWRYGELDERNNVCFGEGGAGLYSDGKLITRIKSPHIPYVMDRLVRFGAPEEIKWLSNPHVGSDRIRRVIPILRNYLLQNGCEIRFETTAKELLYEGQTVKGILTDKNEKIFSDHVILATGHSAEDILNHVIDAGVFVEGKSFAVGLRAEHLQEQINKIQYRDAWSHPKLGSANYKLANHDHKTGIGVYSFCMCPGGYVLSSGTEKDGIVCNGMSNYKRNSPFANAAIVVSIDYNKNFGTDIRAGLNFRKKLEMSFLESIRAEGGKHELPAQKISDFLTGEKSVAPLRKGSSPSGSKAIEMSSLLPTWLRDRLREGLVKFDKNMKGFISEEALLYGVESRTSCPIRITRDEKTLMSISHQGLYPAGEGAGYAGGITSAACDGVKIADQICGISET